MNRPAEAAQAKKRKKWLLPNNGLEMDPEKNVAYH
jgi:hypothetical protein